MPIRSSTSGNIIQFKLDNFFNKEVRQEEKQMPFIDSKITVPVTPEKKEAIKSRLGQSISLLNKSETYLMVGFEDNYDLYMGGEKLEKGAYVSVSLFGEASSAAYEKMTGEICDILADELQIPGEKVYVTYHGVNDWGWNGRNF